MTDGPFPITPGFTMSRKMGSLLSVHRVLEKAGDKRIKGRS